MGSIYVFRKTPPGKERGADSGSVRFCTREVLVEAALKSRESALEQNVTMEKPQKPALFSKTVSLRIPFEI